MHWEHQHNNNNKEKVYFHLGTKEFLAIIVLLIFILIALKPDAFALVIEKLTRLAETPGLIDFVSAITTKAIQK